MIKQIFHPKAIRNAALASTFTLIGSLSLTANAATATDSLAVSATVSNNCTISTTAVGFGSYDPVDVNSTTALDNTGTVTTTCTDGAAVTITLGQGANAGTSSTADAPVRRLTDGTNFLDYSLYSDSARSTVWGDTSETGVDVTGIGTAVDTTVYGRIPAGQNVPAASYSDTVTATVTF